PDPDNYTELTGGPLNSRREMLKLLAAAPLLSAARFSKQGQAQGSAPTEEPQLAMVSRHVQWTSMEEGAAVAAEAGFRAIAWTVRRGAHMGRRMSNAICRRRSRSHASRAWRLRC